MLVFGLVQTLFALGATLNYFFVHPPSTRKTLESLPFGLSRLALVVREEQSDRTLYSLLSPMAFYHFLLVPCSVISLVYDGYFFWFHLLVCICWKVYLTLEACGGWQRHFASGYSSRNKKRHHFALVVASGSLSSNS